MKLFVVGCLLAMVGLSMAASSDRGCVYIRGRCAYECEEGTHSYSLGLHKYSLGCDFWTPEATCKEPNPVKDLERGMLCTFSACYCDKPTVRDTVSNKCVTLEQCPKKEEEKKEEEKPEEKKGEKPEEKKEEKPEEKKEE